MVQWVRLHFECKGAGFNPWSGNYISHAATKTQHSQINKLKKIFLNRQFWGNHLTWCLDNKYWFSLLKNVWILSTACYQKFLHFWMVIIVSHTTLPINSVSPPFLYRSMNSNHSSNHTHQENFMTRSYQWYSPDFIESHLYSNQKTDWNNILKIDKNVCCGKYTKKG